MHLPVTIRYGFVSAACIVLNNVVIISADQLHQPMLVGVSTAFLVVGAIGYRLHCRYTFFVTPNWVQLAQYLGAMSVNTLIAISLLWAFLTLLDWPMMVASPIASLAMILVNFLTSRQVIQGRRSGDDRVVTMGHRVC